MPQKSGKKGVIPKKIRALSSLLDLGASYGIYFYLLSFDNFLKVGEKLVLKTSYINKNLLFTNLILFLLIFLLWRFLTTFILGSSFFQLFLGIYSHSHSLWSRIGGGARVLLEFFFFPIRFFEFVIFPKKKSLFEYITLTSLFYSHNIISKTFFYLSFPLLLLLFLYSPVLQNLTILDGIHIAFSKEKLRPLKRGENFNDYKNYQSLKYKMETVSKIERYDVNFIPSFDVTKQGKRIRISPYMSIFDNKNKVVGIFKSEKKLALMDFIKRAKNTNLFFRLNYPRLTEHLNKGLSSKKIIYKPEFGNDKILDPSIQNEIKDLVRTSFSLSLKNFHRHIFKKGPFVSSYLNFRKSFLDLLDKGSVPHVDLIRIGSNDFLRMRQNFDFLNKAGKNSVDLILPVDTQNSQVYKYYYDNKNADRLLKDKFFKKFLQLNKWNFDYKQSLYVPNKKEEMEPFLILDYFSKKVLDKENIPVLYEYIYEYYLKLSIEAVKSEDELFSSTILRALNRLLLVLKQDKSKQESKLLLKDQLTELTIALKKKDLEFFNDMII